jgi:hypothetical protein
MRKLNGFCSLGLIGILSLISFREVSHAGCPSTTVVEGGVAVSGIDSLGFDSIDRVFLVHGKKTLVSRSLSARPSEDLASSGWISFPSPWSLSDSDGLQSAVKQCIELSKQAYLLGKSFTIYGSSNLNSPLQIVTSSTRPQTSRFSGTECLGQISPSAGNLPLWCELGD